MSEVHSDINNIQSEAKPNCPARERAIKKQCAKNDTRQCILGARSSQYVDTKQWLEELVSGNHTHQARHYQLLGGFAIHRNNCAKLCRLLAVVFLTPVASSPDFVYPLQSCVDRKRSEALAELVAKFWSCFPWVGRRRRLQWLQLSEIDGRKTASVAGRRDVSGLHHEHATLATRVYLLC